MKSQKAEAAKFRQQKFASIQKKRDTLEALTKQNEELKLRKADLVSFLFHRLRQNYFQIDSNSNLDYKNFENICQSMGIDCQSYWSNYNHFIDELVKNRCDIAHGGLDVQSYKYADEVLTKVIEFIDTYLFINIVFF